MKLTSKEKKQIHFTLIKMGRVSPKQRKLFWEYILHHDLGVGYYDAQQLQRKGFQVLKPVPYYEDQPN